MSSSPGSPPPWGSDHPLDEGAMRELLEEQFPELASATVLALQEGWDSRVFLVGETWIFRMPKRADVVPRLAMERRLLPILAPRLPVSVPQLELFGRPGVHCPYPFAAYRCLPGDLGDHVAIGTFRPEPLGRQLGGLLRCLHDVPLALARSAGVPDADCAIDRDLEDVLARDPESIEGVLGPRRWAVLQEAVASGAPDAPDRRVCLRHADLDVGHLLLDHEHLAITGMIDWADASIGDPALDFAAFQVRCGDAFVSSALEAYDPMGGSDLHPWIREAARRVVVIWLYEAIQRDEPSVPGFLRCFDSLHGCEEG